MPPIDDVNQAAAQDFIIVTVLNYRYILMGISCNTLQFKNRDNTETTMEYTLENNIATLHFDDGKVNAVGHQFIDDMYEGLDKAQAEAGAVMIAGKEGIFSAGFDLKELQKGEKELTALVNRGFKLLTRLFSHPQPTIAVCDGHAAGMGAFLLLAADTRVGSTGDYKVNLPETSIGMQFHETLTALIHARVDCRYQTMTMVQSQPLTPEMAVKAGFLDIVVPQEELLAQATGYAQGLAGLPAEFYKINKLDLRSGPLSNMVDA